MNTVPIKVCPHEKPRVERQVAEAREHQIQTLLQEFRDMQMRLLTTEHSHAAQTTDWAMKVDGLHRDLSVLRDQNAQQCARITELTSANLQLQATYLEAKAALGAASAPAQPPAFREMQHYENQLNELRAKSAAANRRCEVVEAENNKLKEELKTVKADLDKQVTHNRNLVKSSNNSHSQLEKKDRALAFIQTEKQNALIETAALGQRAAVLTKALDNKDRELRLAQRTIQEGNAECTRLQQERARIRLAAAETTEEVEAVRSRVKALEGQLAEQASRLAESTAENQRLLQALMTYAGRYNDHQLWVDVTTTCTCGTTPVVMAAHCATCGGTGMQLKGGRSAPRPSCPMHEPPRQPPPPDTPTDHPDCPPLTALAGPHPPVDPGTPAASDRLQVERNANGLLLNRLIETLQAFQQQSHR